MGLRLFYQLLDQGKMEEASREAASLQGEDRAEAELIKAIFVLNTAGSESVIPTVEKILTESQDNPRIHSLTRIVRSWVFYWEAKYETALVELEMAEQLLAKVSEDCKKETRHIKALVLFMKGGYFSLVKKEDDIALKWYNKALQISSEEGFPFKTFNTFVYNNIGGIYGRKGDWTRAIEYNQKVLDIYRDLGNEVMELFPLLQLGNLYHIQGDLNHAIKLIQDGLTRAKQFQTKRGIAWALELLGSIHWSRGESQAAVDCYEQSLVMTQEIKLVASAELSYKLYKLCQFHVNLQELEQAKDYLKQLQKQSQLDPSIDSQIYYQLAESLILKTSQRFKEKARAQDILKEILENKKTSERIRFLALLQLCDLLIQEAKLSEDDGLFIEVRAVTSQVLKLVHTWEFIPDIINALILQAKLDLIEGNANRASNKLEKALQIAEEKNLIHLADQVRKEQTTLKNELKKWQEFVDRNASLQERVAFAEIEEYLHEAIKIRDRTLDE
ncbi:MAG: tetratricopeptide repeat protein [Candidatus Hodarchaeota archaeon]